MCYNVAYIEKRGKKYEERFSELLPDGIKQPELFDNMPSFYFVSGFSHPTLPVITADGVDFFRWGLIPFWVKDAPSAKHISSKTLNAVGETVFEKPSFRNAIKKNRCILGVNAFYEWREYNGKKYPYLIKLKGEEMFSLGCIYENWVDKSTGEILKSFSILTTPANPLMEVIHNNKKRMPLILPRENEKKWIDEKLSHDDIQSLIRPLDDTMMEAYTISTDVNIAKNHRNVPESMEKVDYPELPAA